MTKLTTKIIGFITALLAISALAPALAFASDSGAMISNVLTTTSRTIATVSWTSDKIVRGEVYYSATPFQITEASNLRSEPIVRNGLNTAPETGLMSAQAITFQNLQPNTWYYYLIEATDSSGNVSVTWPGMFMTTQ